LSCQPIYYPKYEHDLALGQSGAQSGIDIPEKLWSNKCKISNRLYH
jgi:hypothetical protein